MMNFPPPHPIVYILIVILICRYLADPTSFLSYTLPVHVLGKRPPRHPPSLLQPPDLLCPLRPAPASLLFARAANGQRRQSPPCQTCRPTKLTVVSSSTAINVNEVLPFPSILPAQPSSNSASTPGQGCLLFPAGCSVRQYAVRHTVYSGAFRC